MTILSIETSTNVCSAALSVGGVPVASCIERDKANHAALLPRFVESLLAETRERGLVIEAVALSEGPGSYTGLRIGASTAKGLCYGLNVPLLPIPTPVVLAAAWAASTPVAPPKRSIVCPMVDARRMEVYTALYDENLQPLSPIEAKVVDEQSFAAELERGEIYFVGDGAMKCAEVIKHKNAHFIDGIVPDARYMGLLAEQVGQRRVEGAELAYFDPLYVKEFVAAPSHVKGLK